MLVSFPKWTVSFFFSLSLLFRGSDVDETHLCIAWKCGLWNGFSSFLINCLTLLDFTCTSCMPSKDERMGPTSQECWEDLMRYVNASRVSKYHYWPADYWATLITHSPVTLRPLLFSDGEPIHMGFHLKQGLLAQTGEGKGSAFNFFYVLICSSIHWLLHQEFSHQLPCLQTQPFLMQNGYDVTIFPPHKLVVAINDCWRLLLFFQL